jgi:shikimate kinase
LLIGYRGAGKTTIAKILAVRLGWNWIDADTALEERFGRSIRTIFAEEGESGFREKESALLDELTCLEEHIVATGGGVVLGAANRVKLRNVGKVVWLSGDPETLWRRLQGDAATPERRPRLTIGGLGEVEELLRIREPLYRECADLIVDTTNRTAEKVAEIIMAELSR